MRAQRPARSLVLSGLVSGSLKSLLYQTLEEYEALKRHCWACPIPILLDSKELPRGYGCTVEYVVPKMSLRSMNNSMRNGPKGGLIVGAFALISPVFGVGLLGGSGAGAYIGMAWVRSATYRRTEKLMDAYRDYLQSFEPGEMSLPQNLTTNMV